jgi:hypothetical protein
MYPAYEKYLALTFYRSLTLIQEQGKTVKERILKTNLSLKTKTEYLKLIDDDSMAIVPNHVAFKLSFLLPQLDDDTYIFENASEFKAITERQAIVMRTFWNQVVADYDVIDDRIFFQKIMLKFAFFAKEFEFFNERLRLFQCFADEVYDDFTEEEDVQEEDVQNPYEENDSDFRKRVETIVMSHMKDFINADVDVITESIQEITSWEDYDKNQVEQVLEKIAPSYYLNR